MTALANLRTDAVTMDRRRFSRRPAEGVMVAMFTDWQGRAGVAPLEAVDSSLTGLGVRSTVELTSGMTVTLAAGGRAPGRCGVVVRSRRDGDEWLVGIAFHARSAAA